MPRFSSERPVAHHADNMFDLVADVERYPEFVPLCERLRVRRRVTAEDGVGILVADMTVAYGPIRETFLSRVLLERPKRTILVEYVDGPFSKLENVWRFEPMSPETSRVHFAIDYEFRNAALAALMGVMFDRAFRTFADAFETRANEVYGRPQPSGASEFVQQPQGL